MALYSNLICRFPEMRKVRRVRIFRKVIVSIYNGDTNSLSSGKTKRRRYHELDVGEVHGTK